MTLIESHPGTALGSWIRDRRRALKLTPSTLANEIKLSHAAYAEVELGITHWIGEHQAQALAEVLLLEEEGTAQLAQLRAEASKAEPIRFEDVFSKEALRPVRLRTLDKSRSPSQEEVETLLDAVFQPLQ